MGSTLSGSSATLKTGAKKTTSFPFFSHPKAAMMGPGHDAADYCTNAHLAGASAAAAGRNIFIVVLRLRLAALSVLVMIAAAS
jgi:hypothetical protein